MTDEVAQTTIATEDQARAWIEEVFAPDAQTWHRLDTFARILTEQSTRQNLVAASTLPHLWVRHIVDSAQLLPLCAGSGGGLWIDLGSGAGLPGIVIAILRDAPMMLVESRKLRCGFLRDVAAELGLSSRVTVAELRAEAVDNIKCDVISARAFAPLPKLIDIAARFAGPETYWVLPKGRNAVNELAMLPQAWHSLFHVEQSLTDADSAILRAVGAAAYKGRNRR